MSCSEGNPRMVALYFWEALPWNLVKTPEAAAFQITVLAKRSHADDLFAAASWLSAPERSVDHGDCQPTQGHEGLVARRNIFCFCTAWECTSCSGLVSAVPTLP